MDAAARPARKPPRPRRSSNAGGVRAYSGRSVRIETRPASATRASRARPMLPRAPHRAPQFWTAGSESRTAGRGTIRTPVARRATGEHGRFLRDSQHRDKVGENRLRGKKIRIAAPIDGSDVHLNLGRRYSRARARRRLRAPAQRASRRAAERLAQFRFGPIEHPNPLLAQIPACAIDLKVEHGHC